MEVQEQLDNLDAQMFNVNGSSSVVNLTNKQIQIYSASLTGFDEENIPVADALGSVFDDDGKRVTGFGSFADTPSFAGGTNYYTANAVYRCRDCCRNQ